MTTPLRSDMSAPVKSRIPRNGMPIVIPDDVARRALTRYTVTPNGCHLSTYSVASHGYAQVGWQIGEDRYGTTAHRAAWSAIHGQIPLGMTIDHLCHVRPCVNPDHLRLLSNPANASDNGQPPVNPHTGTFCTKGHPMARDSGGRTYCRTCSAARKRLARVAP